jgi:hypothetical protein
MTPKPHQDNPDNATANAYPGGGRKPLADALPDALDPIKPVGRMRSVPQPAEGAKTIEFERGPVLTEDQKNAIDATLRQAQLHYSRSQLKQSLAELVKICDIDPTNPDAHGLIGDIKRRQENLKGAGDAYMTAIKRIEPGTARAALEAKLARTLLAQEQAVSQLHTGQTRSARGNGSMTVWNIVASAVMPGIGQCLAGQTSKGVVLFVLWGIALATLHGVQVSTITTRALISILCMCGVWLVSLIDMIISCRQESNV